MRYKFYEFIVSVMTEQLWNSIFDIFPHDTEQKSFNYIVALNSTHAYPPLNISPLLRSSPLLQGNVCDSIAQSSESYPIPVSYCYNSISNWQENKSFIIWQATLAFNLFTGRCLERGLPT